MFNQYNKRISLIGDRCFKLGLALGIASFFAASGLLHAADWNVANSKVENGASNEKYNYYSGGRKSLNLNESDFANLSGNIAFALSDENVNSNADLSGHALNLNSIDFSRANVKRIFGAASYSGAVTKNIVKAAGCSNGANVEIRGGHSYKGKAEGNIVNITASKVDTVLGGSSRNGIADKNKVVIKSNGQKASEVRVVHGGRTWFSNRGANGNEVQVVGSHAFWIYGGESQGGSVSGNKVTLSSDGKNKSLARGVFGGKSRNGTKADVNGNEVSIIGSDVEESHEVDSGVFGGRAEFGSANQNKVSISSDGKNRSIINSNVYGADSTGTNIFGQTPSQANKNEVKIIGSVVNGDVFGANSVFGSTNENTVSIASDGTNRSKVKNVYGGKSGANAATKNAVKVTNSDVNGDIYGGYSEDADAKGNSITIEETNVEGSVYGGYSKNGDASDNTLNFNSGKVKDFLYGGYSENKNVSGNTINIKGGNLVKTGIYGGRALSGDASDNAVNISGGDMAERIFGARASKKAQKNSVTIEGGNFVQGDYGETSIFGARGDEQAANNSVTIKGGNFNLPTDINGGYSNGGKANDNKVDISGGIFEKKASVYGGYSVSGGGAGNNKVSISGGTFKEGASICGGFSNLGGDATGNEVTISGGAFQGESKIYGGFVPSANKAATNNIVNLSASGLNLSSVSIFGGNKDVFTGNTLNVRGKNITAKSIANFEYLNFYMPQDITANDTMLNLLGNDKADLRRSKIGVGMVQGGRLNLNDRIALINSAAGILYPNDMSNHKGQLQAGISAVYDFKLAKDNDNKKLYAVVSTASNANPHAPFKLLPYPKNVLETSVAELGSLSQSSDLLSGVNLQNGAFGAMKGSSVRYKSGSHVDVKSLGIVTGAAKEIASGALGAFIELGGGSYDSYNDFNAIDVRGDGNFRYYGAGLGARFELPSELYTDGSIRLGRIKTDYQSDIPAASKAKYSASRNYYGAHAGLGKVIGFEGASSLDIYSKIFYLTLGKRDVEVVGDRIELKKSTSLRVKAGAKYSKKVSENLAIYAGAAFERGLMGEAKGYNKTYDAPIQSPSIKGNSAIAELGSSFDASENLNFGFKIEGVIGKKRGFGGGLEATYKF